MFLEGFKCSFFRALLAPGFGICKHCSQGIIA